MQYRMLGLDLDGTYLGPHGHASDANAHAIHAAQDAGMLVVPCTGRSWREAKPIIDQFPNPQLGIFITGAMIVDLAKNISIDMAVIEPHLVREIIDFLKTLPEAVLAVKDPAVSGYDYLVTGQGYLTECTQRWFQQTGVISMFIENPTLEDLHSVMRVGVVAKCRRVAEIQADLAAHFGEKIIAHQFEIDVTDSPCERVCILEAFAAGVTKGRGLQWIAQKNHITPKEIIMIGDEINDIAAMQFAGCSIAMGNASPAVKSIARYQTRSNNRDGVAYAISQVLDGRWN